MWNYELKENNWTASDSFSLLICSAFQARVTIKNANFHFLPSLFPMWSFIVKWCKREAVGFHSTWVACVMFGENMTEWEKGKAGSGISTPWCGWSSLQLGVVLEVSLVLKRSSTERSLCPKEDDVRWGEKGCGMEGEGVLRRPQAPGLHDQGYIIVGLKHFSGWLSLKVVMLRPDCRKTLLKWHSLFF